MLCQKCSFRSECKKPCSEVEEYLKTKLNHTTTESENHVSLWVFPEGNSKVWDYANSPIVSTQMLKGQYYSLKQEISTLIESLKLTNRQHQIIDFYYFQGIDMVSIGSQLGISRQAVNQALFGHPIQGGGIVKKIRKAVVQDEYLKNYLSNIEE